ncbi:peptidylprolyl isomerase [Paraglaciecola arctica]|uniref:Peptidyl-prolyl cis-trans isomerase n=1 Tax=Paraglaciecola arctica BSs20135 TaxID=493475 RepID=K6YPF9_9ALTE|nr:peptidylprolyl isomerase [Paraglaciecola arctica]GAC18523.1 peptidyl-prolyl cis-trans isomerase A [Paraglaciecola arctica BSs20135]
MSQFLVKISNIAILIGFSLLSLNIQAIEKKQGSHSVQQAIISTDLGNIEIELYSEQAPVSVSNFIRYIEAGAFNNGRFYRVVRLDNDNGSPKIEVIQGGANTEFKDFAAIPLETTKQTGIAHLDGVLSMARGAPDTATSEFFICIGAQPSLDFGGLRNPDGQGFAAFGRVTKGMHIVRKIHLIRDALEVEDSYVKGQMLAQPVTISNILLTKN